MKTLGWHYVIGWRSINRASSAAWPPRPTCSRFASLPSRIFGLAQGRCATEFSKREKSGLHSDTKVQKVPSSSLWPLHNLLSRLPTRPFAPLQKRFCSLYLLRPIASDEFCFDEMFLEKPGNETHNMEVAGGESITSALRVTLMLVARSSVSGRHGFLVNSVGHLVKSGQLSKVLRHLDEALGGPNRPRRCRR